MNDIPEPRITSKIQYVLILMQMAPKLEIQMFLVNINSRLFLESFVHISFILQGCYQKNLMLQKCSRANLDNLDLNQLKP